MTLIKAGDICPKADEPFCDGTCMDCPYAAEDETEEASDD